MTAIHRGKSIQALSKDLSERAKIGYNKAETLVRTELNHAFNRAALDSMQNAGLDHYRFVATFDHKTCPRCGGIDGLVFEVEESMPGENYPPMHPRCRCTVVPSLGEVVGKRTSKVDGKRVKVPAEMTYTEWRKIYIDKTETLEQWKAERKPFAMSQENNPKWAARDRSKVISKEDYALLRDIAIKNKISLIGVKNFDGSPAVVKEVIETLSKLKNKFPAVSDKRHNLELEMSIFLADEDFAITKGRKISLNANAYRDVRILQSEYQKAVKEGWFVKGTDWRAIIHHEFGHLVSKFYKIDSMKIACEITSSSHLKTLEFVGDMLSTYAAKISDGGEIIAEVFSDMSTNNPCDFSLKFYNKVLEIVGESKK